MVETADKVSAVETTLSNAKGSKGSIDERLDVSIKEDGILVDDAKIHTHGKVSFKVPTEKNGTSLFAFSEITECSSVPQLYTNAASGYVRDELEVYLNGMLQVEGATMNYIETVTNNIVTGVDFGGVQLTANDDIITLKWTKYNRR